MKNSNQILLVMLLTIFPLTAVSQNQSNSTLEAKEVRHSQSLHQVMTTWTNQNNQAVQLADFSGEPLMVVMFYRQCTGTCPILIKNTWDLYQSLDEKIQEDISVLAVSFDYENDTPTSLKQYAAYEQLDIPGWHFVTAQHSDIRRLAMMLGIQYRQRSDGHFEHTNLITILDRDGNISARVDGLGQTMNDAVQTINTMYTSSIQ